MKTKKSFQILYITLLFLGIFHIYGLSQCPPIENILGNDTLICPDGALYLNAGDAASFLWSDGTTESYLLITEPGTYSVSFLIDGCEEDYTDTIEIALAENPDIAIILPVQDYFCKGESINLSVEENAPTGILSYEWVETSSTDASIQIDTTGYFSVIVTNEYGCQSSQNIEVEFQFPFQEDRILLSSYDPSEERYFVVWQTTPGKRSKAYSIVNGLTQSNVFGSPGFDDTNIMIDYETDPHARSNYYNITLSDSCDNSSDLRIGDAHKTMFLEINETDDGNALLSWERYIGFNYEYYYIHRGTDLSDMGLLDSLKYRLLDKASYLDDSAEPGINYYYQIKIKTPETIFLNNSDGKKSESGPFIHSYSNLEDNRINNTGINNFHISLNNLQVHPNPFSDVTTISYSIEKPSVLNIEIYNILGKKIFSLFEGKQEPGDYSVNYYPPTDICRSGIYYLRVEIEGASVLTKKLIQK